MNNSKTCIKTLAVAFTLGLSIPVSQAALSITSSDVVDNSFSYSLVTTSTKDSEAVLINGIDVANNTPLTRMRNDVLTRPNANFRRDGNYFLVSPDNGTTTASVVYKFDFTDAGFYINTVTFSDTLRTFASNATVRTEYSLTGEDGSWTTLKEIANVSKELAYDANETINLTSLVSTIYYRVSFVANTGTMVTGTQYQWGRTDWTSSKEAFKAVFTLAEIPVVPEPGTWALIAGSFCVVVVASRSILVRNRNSTRSEIRKI